MRRSDGALIAATVMLSLSGSSVPLPRPFSGGVGDTISSVVANTLRRWTGARRGSLARPCVPLTTEPGATSLGIWASSALSLILRRSDQGLTCAAVRLLDLDENPTRARVSAALGVPLGHRSTARELTGEDWLR